jgi:L-lysine 2,3-aminomutase
MKYRPMIEDFRRAIIEERKKGLSEARIEMMLDYIEAETSITLILRRLNY